jgi:DNA-binding NtrC family response regulator
MTILLVDDEAPVRTVVAIMLRRAGYDVVEAESGKNALRRFREHDSPIHILVSDIDMPGILGPALAQYLIGEQPELLVLFISGCVESLPAAARHHHRIAFLEKPFRAAELIATLQGLVARASAPVVPELQLQEER